MKSGTAPPFPFESELLSEIFKHSIGPFIIDQYPHGIYNLSK